MRAFLILIFSFSIFISIQAQQAKYELLNINNIEIKISNNGNLGGEKVDNTYPTAGGYFEDNVFIYSGGLYFKW